jgi:hypothetical protein
LTYWRTLHSWRKAPKHRDTSKAIWLHIVRPASTCTPRLRTEVDGATSMSPMSSEPVRHGRRTEWHQSNSVLVGLIWRRFDPIHLMMSLTQAAKRSRRRSASAGRHDPYTCVSSAYRWHETWCAGSTSAGQRCTVWRAMARVQSLVVHRRSGQLAMKMTRRDVQIATDPAGTNETTAARRH